ncbi:hypothetical protein R3P38DRAFT_1474773 [Favolaschia claudopus]|uniref:Uncharacterized protein n=1 Tax=Favolaschia claudopus TaxID=2862362 RepID=A0AAW0DSS4_9AGAR
MCPVSFFADAAASQRVHLSPAPIPHGTTDMHGTLDMAVSFLPHESQSQQETDIQFLSVRTCTFGVLTSDRRCSRRDETKREFRVHNRKPSHRKFGTPYLSGTTDAASGFGYGCGETGFSLSAAPEDACACGRDDRLMLSMFNRGQHVRERLIAIVGFRDEYTQHIDAALVMGRLALHGSMLVPVVAKATYPMFNMFIITRLTTHPMSSTRAAVILYGLRVTLHLSSFSLVEFPPTSLALGRRSPFSSSAQHLLFRDSSAMLIRTTAIRRP